MPDPTIRHLTQRTPHPSQLKALAHPARLQMLEMLRLDGPGTSTSLAARLGMNSGTVSYHLRQLALHGFIEDDPEHESKRERWWRATHEFTHVPYQEPQDVEDRQARQAYLHAYVLVNVTQLQEALSERADLPRRWASVTEDSDWTIWLTPSEVRALMERLTATIREVADAAPRDREHAPEGCEQYTLQLHGFPRPRRLVPEHRVMNRKA